MRLRRHALATSILIGALGLGCASDGIDVSTTYDPLYRFPASATYVWDTAANQLPDDPRFDQMMDASAVIEESANAEFAKRGYTLSTTGAANYKLSYDLAVHTWYAANNSSSVGSLSFWLVESATKHRVWMGYVRAEIHVGLSREERVKRMREALARLLEKFPPSQRGDG